MIRGGLGSLVALAAASGTVPLPVPHRPVVPAALCAAVACTLDRSRTSFAPGPVRDDELVDAAVAPDGGLTSVTVTQHLALTGTGDYQLRERGPVRAATGLAGTDPPVTKLGTVVWQGYASAGRALAARLVLDPAIEAAHLPFRLTIAGAGRDGLAPAGSEGLAPAGTPVTVTLTNLTSTSQPLAQPADPSGAGLAPLLDRLRRFAATDRSGSWLPAAGSGLPAALPGRAVVESAMVSVPLRVIGRLGPGPVTGPGTGPAGSVAGYLAGGTSVTWTVRLPPAGRLALDLTAWPALDPRSLDPPAPARSWTAWAAARPAATQRQQAGQTLVAAAAAGARAAAYAPYLGADLPGTGSTLFHLSMASAAPVGPPANPLRPRPVPIALAGLAGLALAVALGALWRRS